MTTLAQAYNEMLSQTLDLNLLVTSKYETLLDKDKEKPARLCQHSLHGMYGLFLQV
jgi:hypothetical protein